jgi:L-lactate dehydrogenase (cytochrome)
MVDGGFHRGTDLVKAIALGARFVLIGRPFLYAVATAGLLGILKAANILQTEINRDMALFGPSAIEDISSECLVPRAPPAPCSPL